MIISKVVSALPSIVVTNAEIAPICGSDEIFLEQKAGISTRHFLSPTENETWLALQACQGLLDHIRASDIGLCIWVGQVRKQTVPHASALLHASLELPQNCICLDLGLACSGYVHALAVADAMMRAAVIDSAMVVTCDPYSRILDMTDRNTAPLFGDAATATLLRASGTGIILGRSDLGTDGKGAKYLECSAGGRLHMDGKGIFNFALRQVPTSVRRCLSENSASIEEIDYFIFHQANAFMLKHLCKIMAIDESKCPIRMRNVANTVSSSIPLVLEQLKLENGNRLILSGFGAGLSWGTIYGRYEGGTER